MSAILHTLLVSTGRSTVMVKSVYVWNIW